MERALDRDFFMSSKEAKEWGMVDEIITQRPPQEAGQLQQQPTP